MQLLRQGGTITVIVIKHIHHQELYIVDTKKIMLGF